MRKIQSKLIQKDQSIFFWVNQKLKCRLHDLIMPYVTHLGGAVWSCLLSVGLLFSKNHHWHHIGVILATSLSVSHFFVSIFKRSFFRKRPYQLFENIFTGKKLMKDSSFPSGHTTSAFCQAGILSLAVPNLMFIFFLLASFIGISRIYLGQHFPTDVLIGASLGLGTALFVF